MKTRKTDGKKSPQKLSGIEALVFEDIARRQQAGIRKYGTTLSENPAGRLERLQHAYEESLDLPLYLRWEIERTKQEMKWPPTNTSNTTTFSKNASAS